jgi:hypothetical protein
MVTAPHNCTVSYHFTLSLLSGEQKRHDAPHVKYWQIIADNLSKAGFSLGWVSALDLEGQTIWIVDTHGYGKRFVVRADEKLTAFLELESAFVCCEKS